MGFDVQNMDFEELKQAQAQLAKVIKDKEKVARVEAIIIVAEKIKEFSLTSEEIQAALQGKTKVRKARKPSNVLYRDPASGKTWNGLGRRPKWAENLSDAELAELREVTVS